jgi:hypothetical protein
LTALGVDQVAVEPGKADEADLVVVGVPLDQTPDRELSSRCERHSG